MTQVNGLSRISLVVRSPATISLDVRSDICQIASTPLGATCQSESLHLAEILGGPWHYVVLRSNGFDSAIDIHPPWSNTGRLMVPQMRITQMPPGR